jgi:hypothetical protein
MSQQPEPPRRYGCTYKPDCDHEATDTVVINGKPRAVCYWCRQREITRQNTERAMKAMQQEREQSA